MGEGKLKERCWGLKNDRSNVHNEVRSGGLSIQTNEIVEQINRKLQNDRRLTINALAGEFALTGRTSIYTKVTKKRADRTNCVQRG